MFIAAASFQSSFKAAMPVAVFQVFVSIFVNETPVDIFKETSELSQGGCF